MHLPSGLQISRVTLNLDGKPKLIVHSLILYRQQSHPAHRPTACPLEDARLHDAYPHAKQTAQPVSFSLAIVSCTAPKIVWHFLEPFLRVPQHPRRVDPRRVVVVVAIASR